MDKSYFTFLAINIFIIGFAFWIVKVYLDRLIKGNNFEMERITRKEANEMIESAVEELNQKIDKLYGMFESVQKEIMNIKITLTRIETCLERNGKLSPKS